MKWATATIDAIKAPSARALAGGPFGSNLTTRDYVDEGVPVIRGVNLPSDKKFLDDDFVFVSEEKAIELAPNVARPGDLIFTQRGTLGQVGLIPQNANFQRYVISQSQMKLTVDPTKADALFVYYFFRHPMTVEAVQRRAITSGVPHINLGILRDFELPLPPVSTQSAIGEFLASYDDLIENNTRRIALLEQSARLLYEEWFVRLRFPGREHATFANSPLGNIPVGWNVVTLGQITSKIGSGATPRGGQAAYHDEGITLIRSQNVYDYRFDDEGLAFLNEHQAAELDNVCVEPGDILLNITGASVARCCMAPERHLPARVNQHVMIIRARPEIADPSFALCSINSDNRKRQLLSYAQVGSTREALTKEGVSNFQIILPEHRLLQQFSGFAGAAFRQREILAHQNAKLRAARDLLLPRLMSGEVTV